MQQSFLCGRAEARAAGAKGHGVFAIAPIPAGTTVAAFGGWICDGAELGTLTEERRTHSIQIDDDLYMVGPDEQEEADYFNHSCAPNTGVVGNILLVAMRDIAAGEEICFDYAMSDAADYDEFDSRVRCAVVPQGRDRCRLEAPGAARPLRRLAVDLPAAPPRRPPAVAGLTRSEKQSEKASARRPAPGWRRSAWPRRLSPAPRAT